MLSGHATNGFVPPRLRRPRRRPRWVDRVVKDFDVRKGPRDPAARALSGGNLQKFIVGREILREPGVLVVSQPTWGVDAGAARRSARRWSTWRARARRFSSSARTSTSLFEIADRIAVMFHGRLSDAAARARG